METTTTTTMTIVAATTTTKTIILGRHMDRLMASSMELRTIQAVGA